MVVKSNAIVEPTTNKNLNNLKIKLEDLFD